MNRTEFDKYLLAVD
jgi:adenylate kinase